MGSAPLPGGVEGIRRAIGDRIVTPPATLVTELTRRFYNATDAASKRDEAYGRLLEWLTACQLTDACGKPPLHADHVPLPGPPAFWTTNVFEHPPAPEHLMLAILADRGASLLHTALLSMDEPTRAWLIERPDLVQRLSTIDRGALAVVAPFIRIDNGRWRLPGGAAADRLWMDLAGARLEDSPAFLLALLRAHDGLLAYALEVVATLDAPRQTRLLELDATDPEASMTAGRAFMAALKPSAEFWRPGERPFWRPAVDPSLLLMRLSLDAKGRFDLAGGRKVWQIVFDGGDALPSDDRIREAWDDPAPVSVPWLIAHIGDAVLSDRIIRAEQVQFASRVLAGQATAAPRDVVTTLCGYARFPQLLRVLERMGVTGAARLAAMVRHAAAIEDAGDGWRGRHALLQWQGLVSLLDYGVRVGGVSREDAAVAIDALATLPAEPGVHARWLGAWLRVSDARVDVTSRSLEQALLKRLTATPGAMRRVTWEGEPYHLDPGAGERDRIAHARGRDNRPVLDAAVAFEALSAAPAAGSGRSAAEDLAALTAAATAAGLDRTVAIDDEWGRLARESLAAARRLLARDGAGRPSADARRALADASDALLTSALVELTYAVSMGWSEDLPLTAAAASRRHLLVRPITPMRRQPIAWSQPQIVTDRRQPWSVIGSLLGLDVGLAPVATRRVTMRPLTAAPLLNNADRQLLISTLAVLDRRDFTDEAQTTVTAAVARARTQLEADPAQSAAAAGVSPLRRTLASWLAATDRAALPSFFTLAELTRMGAGEAPLAGALARWGTFDGPISGRLVSGPLPELPAERYAGRSGRVLACAVPDLTIALTLGLSQLGLPAALVPDLLPAALYDLVNTTPSRHTDDWQAIADRAQAVDRDAVERYLGLLTTQGPLRADAASPTH